MPLNAVVRHMWRDFVFRIAAPALAYGFIGWWIGTKLIAIPQFQTFKVLNIIGLSFDLAGVSILSRFISSNQRYQTFVSGPFAEQFLGFVMSASIGLYLCSYFGPDGPSKAAVESLAFWSLAYLMLPVIFFITNFVTGPEGKLLRPEESRARLLGGVFLIGGIIIQLFAAALDLYS